MELSGAATVKYWQGARTDFSSPVICVPSTVAPFSQSPGRGERLSHLLNAYTCQAWHLPQAPSVPYPQVNSRLGHGECSTPWPCPLSSQLCGGQVLAFLSLGTLLVPPPLRAFLICKAHREDSVPVHLMAPTLLQ